MNQTICCTNLKIRVSIVICTLNREEVMCATVRSVFKLLEGRQDGELIVVDQTRQHTEATEQCLNELAKDIRWERVNFTGVTLARNQGVRLARGEIVLFLDDDVEPFPHLIDEHLACYEKPEIWGVCGCALLPGKRKLSRDDLTSSELHDVETDHVTRFDLDWPRITTWAVGCNMSFRRDKILAVGGFDEVFYGMAVGEEPEFCFRLRKAGGVIQYTPAAELVHLVNPTGGCRSAKWTEEKIEQMLNNSFYMFRKIEWPWLATWRNLLRQCFIISVNKKSLREWTWPQLSWWCLKGLSRVLSYNNKMAKLPFLKAGKDLVMKK